MKTVLFTTLWSFSDDEKALLAEANGTTLYETELNNVVSDEMVSLIEIVINLKDFSFATKNNTKIVDPDGNKYDTCVITMSNGSEFVVLGSFESVLMAIHSYNQPLIQYRTLN